jgi:beta-lactamase class A
MKTRLQVNQLFNFIYVNLNKKNLFLSVILIGSLLTTGNVSAEREGGWEPLYHLVDSSLQSRLEQEFLSIPKLRKLIKRNKLAIGVVDMNGDIPKFARINGNTMMYAASLPKIAILLAAYQSFEDGSLQETEEMHTHLANMIRVSSNDSATRIIDEIGFEKISSVLQDPQFKLYDERRGGGLWVGKRYAKTGKRLPDPIHHISHGATVTQICRFYYLLANHRLINYKRSEQMLNDLSNPALNHKFVASLKRLAPNADLYRKSGTWKQWHSDSVLVQGQDWRNYILTAMVENRDGSKIIEDIVPIVESVLRAKTTTAKTTTARTTTAKTN